MSETPGSKILGYFAMHYEGVYIPGQDYTFLSLVIYAGGLWLCIKKTGTVNVDPGSNNKVWVLSSTSAATAEYLDVINTLHDLDESFDTRLQQANDAKSAAEVAKTDALGSASQAAGSAQAAQIDKDAAQVAAGQAQVSANEAAESANDANASKLAAQSAADSAQGSAAAAAGSKSAAESAMAGAQEAQAAAEQTAADFQGIVNLVGAGNPNLLDDWDFRNPVNQRGVVSNYVYGYAYTYDRWLMSSYVWIAVGTSVNLTVYDGTPKYIDQYIEQDLRGKTYTLSVDLTGVGIKSVVLYYPSNGQVARDYYGALDISLVRDGNYDKLHIVNWSQSEEYLIRRVKLELGTVSTMHLDPPMNHAVELAKCKRFYRLWKTDAARTASLLEVGLMRTAAPTTGTIVIGGATYYYASSDL